MNLFYISIFIPLLVSANGINNYLQAPLNSIETAQLVQKAVQDPVDVEFEDDTVIGSFINVYSYFTGVSSEILQSVESYIDENEEHGNVRNKRSANVSDFRQHNLSSIQLLENFVLHDGGVSKLFPNIKNISKPCVHDSLVILWNLFSRKGSKEWALKFFDAAGKPGAGITEGNLVFQGSFDECIKMPITDTFNNTRFGTQFCSAVVGPAPDPDEYNPTGASFGGFKFSFCVPRSCSEYDVGNVTKFLADKANISMNGQPYVPLGVDCQTSNGAEFSLAAVLMIVVFTCFGVLVVIGTLMDGFVEYVSNVEKESGLDIDNKALLLPIWYEFLLCFSAIRNTKAIFATNTNPTDRNKRLEGKGLNSVHGIRFISMMWVVYTHAFVYGVLGWKDPLNFFATLTSWSFQPLPSASFSVDTFFALSGMLLAYGFSTAADSGRKINWFQYYVHRYWRLTPVYMLILGGGAALINYAGNGPDWNPLTNFPGQCQSTFWANLLYVNNIWTLSDGCMAWTWYLANDMQFYAISPLFLIPFLNPRWRKFSYVVFALLCLVYLVSTITVVAVYDIPVSLSSSVATSGKEWTYYSKYYLRPWTRAGAYLVGVAFGRVVYLAKQKKWRIPLWANLLGWFLTTVLSAVLVYCLKDVNGGLASTTIFEQILYNTFSRPVWAALIGWVILSCELGQGGLADAILSFRGFQPLSRLAYCTYLIHPIILIIVYNGMKSKMAFSQFTVSMFGLGFVVASFSAAYVISICFEAPAIKLEKLLNKLLSSRAVQKPSASVTGKSDAEQQASKNE